MAEPLQLVKAERLADRRRQLIHDLDDLLQSLLGRQSIIGWRFGDERRWSLTFNPILDNSYVGFSRLDFAPSTRLDYKIDEKWTVAAEEYADFGELRGFLPADQQSHQLWGVVGTRTISLGLLGPHPAILPFSVVGTVPVTAFAVTEETAGGVVSSTNPAVAAGSVPL